MDWMPLTNVVDELDLRHFRSRTTAIARTIDSGWQLDPVDGATLRISCRRRRQQVQHELVAVKYNAAAEAHLDEKRG